MTVCVRRLAKDRVTTLPSRLGSCSRNANEAMSATRVSFANLSTNEGTGPTPGNFRLVESRAATENVPFPLNKS